MHILHSHPMLHIRLLQKEKDLCTTQAMKVLWQSYMPPAEILSNFGTECISFYSHNK